MKKVGMADRVTIRYVETREGQHANGVGKTHGKIGHISVRRVH